MWATRSAMEVRSPAALAASARVNSWSLRWESERDFMGAGLPGAGVPGAGIARAHAFSHDLPRRPEARVARIKPGAARFLSRDRRNAAAAVPARTGDIPGEPLRNADHLPPWACQERSYARIFRASAGSTGAVGNA